MGSAEANIKTSVTKEEKDKANNINVLEYLLSIGEPLKNEGSFYRHEEHDSLVVNGRRNYFSWNSRNVNGNAVTYLMNVHNMKFPDAVKKINADIEGKDFTNFKVPEPEYPDVFSYDVNEVQSADNVLKYLVDDRKIDADLVQSFIKADLIKEDSYRNVVFKWKEKGELIGANLQGTREMPEEKRLHNDRKYFKKVMPTTKEATHSGFSFTRGYPEKLYFFEAPIDMLSYLSLNRSKLMNCRLMSMDGLKQETFVQTLRKTSKELQENGRELDSIILCVDNDDAGKEFVNKIQGYDITLKSGKEIPIKTDIPDLPEGVSKWDWNNELKAQVEFDVKKNSLNEQEL